MVIPLAPGGAERRRREGVPPGRSFSAHGTCAARPLSLALPLVPACMQVCHPLNSIWFESMQALEFHNQIERGQRRYSQSPGYGGPQISSNSTAPARPPPAARTHACASQAPIEPSSSAKPFADCARPGLVLGSRLCARRAQGNSPQTGPRASLEVNGEMKERGRKSIASDASSAEKLLPTSNPKVRTPHLRSARLLRPASSLRRQECKFEGGSVALAAPRPDCIAPSP